MARSEAPMSFDAILFQDPGFGQFDGKIEARLPATVGSSASGRSAAMIAPDIPSRAAHVGAIGGFPGSVMTMDRRIRIDQDDLVALRAQRLAGLRAGVVELARLADHDRAGADDQNLS